MRRTSWSRFVHWLAGPPRIRRLTVAHFTQNIADSMITLSLIGSLFFSVSFEASRTRIVLYLMLTAAPLAVVAQVVGPALDRIRAGSKVIVALSHLVRAAVALALASSLLSLAFYPLVFGILLARKAYTVARISLVAQLVPARTELSGASAHLSRIGTLAGGVGTAVGGALIAAVGVEWLPVVAAVLFLVAGAIVVTIHAPAVARPAESVTIRVVPPADVRRAAAGVAVIRLAEGSLTFLLGLSIKRGGGDTWIFVAALVAAGFGHFLGTIVAPRLHQWMSSDSIVLLTLLVPGAMSAFGVLTIGSASIIVIALAIGLGSSTSARAMDGLYSEVPHLIRGRVIARNELLFQLSNVSGATFAVLLYPGPRVGFAVVAAGLVAGGLAYASEARLALRSEARRWLMGQRIRRDALPLALLAEAIRYHEHGDHEVCIVVADSAVRAMLARSTTSALPPSPAPWELVREMVDAVVAGQRTPGPEEARSVIDAASAVIRPAVVAVSPLEPPPAHP